MASRDIPSVFGRAPSTVVATGLDRRRRVYDAASACLCDGSFCYGFGGPDKNVLDDLLPQGGVQVVGRVGVTEFAGCPLCCVRLVTRIRAGSQHSPAEGKHAHPQTGRFARRGTTLSSPTQLNDVGLKESTACKWPQQWRGSWKLGFWGATPFFQKLRRAFFESLYQFCTETAWMQATDRMVDI